MNPFKRLVSGVLKFFYHKKTHAFQVKFDGQIYYVCARCSGLYLGVLIGFPLSLFLLIFTPFYYVLNDLQITVIALLMGIPTIVDWTTQRLALRESNNGLRFFSAFFAGFALTWYVVSPVTFFVKIGFLLVVVGFVAFFTLIDRRSASRTADSIQENVTEKSEVSD